MNGLLRTSRRGIQLLDSKAAFLRNLLAVGAQSDRDLLALAALFDEVELAPGHVLVREGERRRDLFLVVEGQAIASANGAVVGTVAPGEFVGEMSLLDAAPHAATVTALTPMRVLAAARSSYGALLNNTAILRHMATTVSRRLRHVEHAPPWPAPCDV